MGGWVEFDRVDSGWYVWWIRIAYSCCNGRSLECAMHVALRYQKTETWNDKSTTSHEEWIHDGSVQLYRKFINTWIRTFKYSFHLFMNRVKRSTDLTHYSTQRCHSRRTLQFVLSTVQVPLSTVSTVRFDSVLFDPRIVGGSPRNEVHNSHKLSHFIQIYFN